MIVEQKKHRMNCHPIPAWWKLVVHLGPAKEHGLACLS